MPTLNVRTKRSDQWFTPQRILRALGEFDLDPCTSVNRPWDTARIHYTPASDGLLRPWTGRVWLNPPYGSQTAPWLAKLARHGNGIALVFARTETSMFQKWVWDYASAVLFLKGRIYFYKPDGTRAKKSSGAPSVLIAYGDDNAAALIRSGLEGKIFYQSPVKSFIE